MLLVTRISKSDHDENHPFGVLLRGSAPFATCVCGGFDSWDGVRGACICVSVSRVVRGTSGHGGNENLMHDKEDGSAEPPLFSLCHWNTTPVARDIQISRKKVRKDEKTNQQMHHVVYP